MGGVGGEVGGVSLTHRVFAFCRLSLLLAIATNPAQKKKVWGSLVRMLYHLRVHIKG